MSEKKLPQTFRANVGAIIINTDGLVLALERKKISDAWQFPQGGLEKGEEPWNAVLREIQEETGITESHLELLETHPYWLGYEFPKKARVRQYWRGQVQKWFLFRFIGTDDDITLGEGKEFRASEWILMETLLPKIVEFKRPVYQALAAEFKSYLKSLE